MSNSTPNSTSIELEDQNWDASLKATRCFLPELQSLSTRIAAVQEISMAINQSLNLDQILQVVGQQAKWLLDFDHCSICLCQKDGSHQLISLFDCSDQSFNIVESSAVQRAINARQPQLLRDAGLVAEDWRSQLIIPLESESEVLGTINFVLHKPQAYTQEDVRIAYLLALQLAAAMRNAKRFEEANQLYAELQHAYGELRQLEGLRDELTHMIVHDLRNPLSSILVGLEMAEITQANRVEHQQWVEMAQNASNSMSGMIDDLLHLSKLEAGKLQPVFTHVDIVALVLEKEEAYQAQANLQKKTLVLQLPSRSPAVTADGNLISRVMDNLVGNAFKYTKPGGYIEISVTSDLEMLQVAVRDNGLGVPLEYCDRIFDKFVQVTDSKGASLRKGTGLGLAFCRMAIEAQGGKIWVESVNHEGSTFVFQLPLAHDQMTRDQMTSAQVTADQTTIDQATVNQVTADQATANQTVLLTSKAPIGTANYPIRNGQSHHC